MNVDPFINRLDVIKVTSEEFMKKQDEGTFDLILMKGSFHFNKDHLTFFKNAYRSLKP
jgi:SAM-dependent methyltransferase